jgi:hypothetical protein
MVGTDEVNGGLLVTLDHLRRESVMGVVQGVTRGFTGLVNATTAAAGAVSGAAVSGVVGGVRGTAEGVRSGLSTGSRSTPAAALTLAAFGAVGLVEWPVLLVVGGTALAVRQLTRSPEDAAQDVELTSVPTQANPAPSARSAPTKAAKPAKSPSGATKAAPRKAAVRKTGSRTRG